MMQASCRRSEQRFLEESPALSAFKSIYPDSGIDWPRYGSTVAVKGTGHLVRKGTGGRSSVTGNVTTVFGATGFLGRYVVSQLANMGSQVLVPFRGSEDSHRHLMLMGNLGREYETRNYSFEEVNYAMAEQLAVIAKESGGIMRFIQVFFLGASSSSPSKLLRAKAAGEDAVIERNRQNWRKQRTKQAEGVRRQKAVLAVPEASIEASASTGSFDRSFRRQRKLQSSTGIEASGAAGSFNQHWKLQ